MGGIDVGEGVADDDAIGAGGPGEVAEGLLEEAGLRLAAIALILVVWAVVEGVNAGAVGGEVFLEAGVEGVNIGCGVMPERDAALVGDDDDEGSGAVESGNCGFGAGQDVEVAPASNVGALGRFAVDDAVAVEEDTADVGEGGVQGSLHFILVW